MSVASDIMSKNVISVTPDTNVGEAVEVLAKTGIHGMPVVDGENKVVGMLSDRDLLGYSSELHVIPLIAFSGWISPYTDVSEIASFEKGFKSLLSTKVKNVMSPKVTTVRQDTPIRKIVGLMSKKEFNHIPVVDEDERLVGIIARADIIRYIASGESEADNDASDL